MNFLTSDSRKADFPKGRKTPSGTMNVKLKRTQADLTAVVSPDTAVVRLGYIASSSVTPRILAKKVKAWLIYSSFFFFFNTHTHIHIYTHTHTHSTHTHTHTHTWLLSVYRIVHRPTTVWFPAKAQVEFTNKLGRSKCAIIFRVQLHIAYLFNVYLKLVTSKYVGV